MPNYLTLAKQGNVESYGLSTEYSSDWVDEKFPHWQRDTLGSEQEFSK